MKNRAAGFWFLWLAGMFIAGTVLAVLPAVAGTAFLSRAHAVDCPAGTVHTSKDSSCTPACPDGNPAPTGDVSSCPSIDCSEHELLGIIPTWHKYFGKDYGTVSSNNSFIPPTCGVVSGTIQEHAVQVGLAIIDMLLRAGALVAVAFVIMGGYRYMSSQGEPKNLEAAMATIVNAAIGLGIVITATVLVSFIGKSLGG